jgi:arylsulfatase A-like enzyme
MPRNILFVMLDDVGKMGMPFYPEWRTAELPAGTLECPSITAFAGEPQTRIFDSMRSTPICWSTRIEALSGRKTFEIGGRMSLDKKVFPFRGRKNTITDFVFRYLPGYETGAFGKWHLSQSLMRDLTHPRRCGVNEYALAFEDGGDTRTRYWNTPWVTSEEPRKATRLPADRFSDDEALARALTFMSTRLDKGVPWYCQVWFNLTHQPIVDLPGIPLRDGTDDVAQYRNMALYADRLFGQLVAFLKDRGAYDSTMIVLTSDNGGIGIVGGEKSDVSELGTNVPFLIRAPGAVRGGRERRLAQLTDLFCTFTEYAGNPQQRSQSKSLYPLFRAGTEPLHDFVAMSTYQRNFMVTDGRWKLRTPPQCRHRQSACANLELYDLRNDPLEERQIQIGKLAPAQRRQALDARARMEKFALANGLAS